MRLAHIIKRVYFSPMLITADGFASIDRVIQSKLADDVTTETFRIEEENVDAFGDPLPVMEVSNGVALIPIVGPIGYRISGIERVCGITDIGEVKDNIKAARENADVETILLDIHSPGGEVTHIPETADYIAETAKVKKVLAFTDTIMASAAYYLAAGANEIYATPSADVGSIGVYSYVLQPEADENVFVAKSGKYKGMGLTKLNDEQKALIQSEVDMIGADFRSFVRAHRKEIADDTMEGQTFMGTRAKLVGLVDVLVNDFDEVILS